MEMRNDLIPALMRMYASTEAEIDPEFNQFGIRRAENQEQDTFNDFRGIYLPQKDELYIWPATTDPGIEATRNKPGGAAHLCTGYWHNMWVIDIHAANNQRFAHEAFCQRPGYGCLPVHIWRDLNRDTQNNDRVYQSGNDFGINGHRASVRSNLPHIGPYSEGCQVTQDHLDHEREIALAKETRRYRENNRCLWSYLLFLVKDIPELQI